MFHQIEITTKCNFRCFYKNVLFAHDAMQQGCRAGKSAIDGPFDVQFWTDFGIELSTKLCIVPGELIQYRTFRPLVTVAALRKTLQRGFHRLHFADLRLQRARRPVGRSSAASPPSSARRAASSIS